MSICILSPYFVIFCRFGRKGENHAKRSKNGAILANPNGTCRLEFSCLKKGVDWFLTQTCRHVYLNLEKHVDMFVTESSEEETLAAARRETQKSCAARRKNSTSTNPEGILQCGQQQSCIQQAKEKIGTKITEIQRLDL